MKLWCKALLTSGATLERAIEVLNTSATRIVLIIDEDDLLVGTLTDGDIRRAILKHMPLSTPVGEVMNTQPKTAEENWTKNRVLALLEEYNLLQLPILDTAGRVIGLYDLHELANKHRCENPVFLMAGGFGTRLRPLTNNCPKPMLKIGHKPILEQILVNFIDAGFYRFFISTHYMPEVISDYFGDGEKWGVSIRYIHEEKPLGTGGALGLLPHSEINHPLFVMNGDLLTSVDLNSLLQFHANNQGVATMCVREYEHQVPFGVITSEGAQIKSITEKPINRFFVNAGIYILEPSLVKSVLPNIRIDMPILLTNEIDSGNTVNMFPVLEEWLDIGRIDEFERAQLLVNSDGQF
jgi:dTDP-glucose pyrophosphorylase